MSLLWLAGAALAQDYRAPFGDADYGYFYPTAYYDHSGVDWACGSIRYSGHRGSDFGGGSWTGMDAGRDIVAAADGVVAATNDGEFDECSTGNCSGGGGYGNYVKLTHADGKSTYYAHLKTWSLTVSTGQSVSCGDKLGEMGSSGYSTGPHLHFESRTSGGSQVDPFDGSCSSPPSYWVSQGSHGSLPGKTCETSTVDADGDGYSSDSDCDDSNASVHPGAAEVCDDGVDNDCTGGDASSTSGYIDGDGDGYGGAATTGCGSLPDGAVATGGDCDDNSALVNPGAAEACDGIDNDCDGAIDDGSPADVGEPLPALAAALIDHSFPAALAPGEQAEVWLVLENVGTQTWPRGALRLEAASTETVSPLYDEERWPSWQLLAVLDEEVPPGGTGALVGSVRSAADAAAELTETFTLTADGAPVPCPFGGLTLTVRSRAASPSAASPTIPTTGCSHAPAPVALLLPLLPLLLWRRP